MKNTEYLIRKLIGTGCRVTRNPVKYDKWKYLIFISLKWQRHRFYDGLFSYFPLPSISHPRAGSQVWWRSQCGSLLSVQPEPEVNSRRLNTMANNDDIRYCQRFSYVFLKFLLFFYSIVFWVSWTVSVGQSAACRGCLCVAMFLWAGDSGRVGRAGGLPDRNEMFGSSKHAGSSQYIAKSEDFIPSPNFYDSQRWSDRCCHLWRSEMFVLTTWPHPSLLTFTWLNLLDKD